MLEMKYFFKIHLIILFKILKRTNAYFLKENYLFLRYFDDEKCKTREKLNFLDLG